MSNLPAPARRPTASFPALALATVFAGVLVMPTSLPAEETAEQRLIVSIERIWDRAAHCAFTDLIQFDGRLYCTFREGSGHIPGLNGTVRVIRSSDGMNWESVALLVERHVDLRDPKLSVTPDGRLMVNTGASYYHGRDRQRIESRVAFSDSSGEGFEAPQRVELPESIETGFDWLWRVTWHNGWAWGCVQQVPPAGTRTMHLVRSRDGISYEQVTQLEIRNPTETTLRFMPDETMVAMIRRAAEPQPLGWIGLAKPPYTEWQYLETDRQFGGPNLVRLPNGTWLAGSRGYRERPHRTELWRVDPQSGEFEDLLVLPSDGDTSYPGLVVDEANNRVLVSYYSAHEGQAAIYLVTLRLDALQE